MKAKTKSFDSAKCLLLVFPFIILGYFYQLNEIGKEVSYRVNSDTTYKNSWVYHKYLSSRTFALKIDAQLSSEIIYKINPWLHRFLKLTYPKGFTVNIPFFLKYYGLFDYRLFLKMTCYIFHSFW